MELKKPENIAVGYEKIIDISEGETEVVNRARLLKIRKAFGPRTLEIVAAGEIQSPELPQAEVA